MPAIKQHYFFSFSSVAAILLLVSCSAALARSLRNDETSRLRVPGAAAPPSDNELADLVTGNNNNNNDASLAGGDTSVPYDDPKLLADLWNFLLNGNNGGSDSHVMPYYYSQSALGASSAKRSWPSRGGYRVPSSMKRKMFWTPLGHLPASARLGRPQNLRPSLEDSGSPVFRYG